MVGLGYLLGPLAGIGVWLAVITVPGALRSNFNFEGAITGAFVMIIFGGAACLVVELAVITPLLVAFTRYRWRWLNGWSGSAIGFLLGFLPWFLLGALTPRTNPDQVRGDGAAYQGEAYATEFAERVASAPDWMDNGHWTLAGWAHVLGDAASVGTIGLIAAMVFRVVAVKTSASLPPSPVRSDVAPPRPSLNAS